MPKTIRDNRNKRKRPYEKQGAKKPCSKVIYTNSATKDLNNNRLAREVAKLPDGSIIFVLDADGLLTSWAIANSTNGKSFTIVIANHRSLKECQEMQGQCNLLMKRYPNVNMILCPNTTADQAMMDLSREGKVISAIYLDYCGTYANVQHSPGSQNVQHVWCFHSSRYR